MQAPPTTTRTELHFYYLGKYILAIKLERAAPLSELESGQFMSDVERSRAAASRSQLARLLPPPRDIPRASKSNWALASELVGRAYASLARFLLKLPCKTRNVPPRARPFNKCPKSKCSATSSRESIAAAAAAAPSFRIACVLARRFSPFYDAFLSSLAG